MAHAQLQRFSSLSGWVFQGVALDDCRRSATCLHAPLQRATSWSVGGSIGERRELGPIWAALGSARQASWPFSLSAWGGIVPFVGPLFNYSGDGSVAWHWSLPHAALALVPGAFGVLLGLFVFAESRGVAVGRGRLSLATAGTLLMVCGAWFAVGPLAWPVVSNGGSYFVASTHLRVLAYEVGYSIGTGLILVVCGAFVDGWASRHQTHATTDTRSATVDAVSGPVESGI